MKRIIFLLLAIIPFTHVSEARQPQRGYRGFIEWSNSLRTEPFWDFTKTVNGYVATKQEATIYTGVTTSHGYQINPTFFVGAGVGVERCGKVGKWVVPLFIQGRIDMKFGKFSPFGDLRLGTNVGNGIGAYFSPSIGYRFNWGRKMGVNIGAGLTLAGYTAGGFSYGDYQTGETHYIPKSYPLLAYFSLRIGIDF